MEKVTLSKIEADKIAEQYRLGRVVNLKPIRGGAVNYNYTLETDSGKFVVRVIGRKVKSLDKKLDLEFKVTNYLRGRNVPFEVPNPIEDSHGRYISRISGKRFWVYKRIEGNVGDINDARLKEIARALARYHLTVQELPVKYREDDSEELQKKYTKMEKVKPKNRVDRLMLKNLDFFERCLAKLKDFHFYQHVVFTHQDIHESNVVFDGDKLEGILDFESLTPAPRINDIAYITKSLMFKGDERLDKRRLGLFLKEYETISRLSQKEKQAILPWLIRYNCRMFAEFYEHCFEGKVSDEGCLKWTIDTTKGAIKELGWKI